MPPIEIFATTFIMKMVKFISTQFTNGSNVTSFSFMCLVFFPCTHIRDLYTLEIRLIFDLVYEKLFNIPSGSKKYTRSLKIRRIFVSVRIKTIQSM